MISQKTAYSVSLILCFLIFFHVGNSKLLKTRCDEAAAFNPIGPGGRLYKQHMDSLFVVLSSHASQPSGFYNYTTGGGSSGQDVNGLFLCRGDLTATECQVCLNSATTDILQSCSNVTGAITWYDECLLRYSDDPIFSKMETSGGWLVWEPENVTDGALLNRTLGSLFPSIAQEAAYGTNYPGKKFAVGEANFTDFEKIYALAQCTPDITNLECASCLAKTITYLPKVHNSRGGHVLAPSCVISYSTAQFYNIAVASPPSPPPLPPPPPPPDVPALETNQTGRGTSRATIAAIVSPITAASVAFVAAFFIRAV